MPDEPAQLIILALEQSPSPSTPAAVAAATGLRHRLVARTLERLVDQGVIMRMRRGLYVPHR